jgi:hypothetical protein
MPRSKKVVMAINVRKDKFPYWNNVDTTMLTRVEAGVGGDVVPGAVQQGYRRP